MPLWTQLAEIILAGIIRGQGFLYYCVTVLLFLSVRGLGRVHEGRYHRGEGQQPMGFKSSIHAGVNHLLQFLCYGIIVRQYDVARVCWSL